MKLHQQQLIISKSPYARCHSERIRHWRRGEESRNRAKEVLKFFPQLIRGGGFEMTSAILIHPL